MTKFKFLFTISILLTLTTITIITSNPKNNTPPTLAAPVTDNQTAEILPIIETILPSRTIRVYIAKTSEIKEIDFEDYLTGVLAGEMPASFELEALKAQAVAARSYALSRIAYYNSAGTPPEHSGADICTNYAHCKAWISDEDKQVKWGGDFDKYDSKIKLAVNSTRGEYMNYEGQIVKAFFYAISSGKTEQVEDVWGGDPIPYLKSVPSPEDINAPNFETTHEISVKEFSDKLKSAKPNIKLKKNISECIGDIERTEGGAIAFITIGGEKIKGTQMRTIFNLRSANFEIATDDKTVMFTVKGYGHGVGMSQYGANFLAKDGKTYEEILKTYYTGVEIAKAMY